MLLCLLRLLRSRPPDEPLTILKVVCKRLKQLREIRLGCVNLHGARATRYLSSETRRFALLHTNRGGGRDISSPFPGDVPFRGKIQDPFR
jgi:hypothetical protein